MRSPFSKVPVSPRPQTIAASPDGAFRFVCAALALAMALLIFRIVGAL